MSSGAFSGVYAEPWEGAVSVFVRPGAELGAGSEHPVVRQP